MDYWISHGQRLTKNINSSYQKVKLKDPRVKEPKTTTQFLALQETQAKTKKKKKKDRHN